MYGHTKTVPDEVKSIYREKLFRRFNFLEDQLNGKTYLMGSAFSVADAYLFTVLGWCKFFAIDLQGWPVLSAYMAGIHARPAVQAALRAEASD